MQEAPISTAQTTSLSDAELDARAGMCNQAAFSTTGASEPASQSASQTASRETRATATASQTATHTASDATRAPAIANRTASQGAGSGCHIPCDSTSTIRIDVGAHDVSTCVSNTQIGVVAYVQNRPRHLFWITAPPTTSRSRLQERINAECRRLFAPTQVLTRWHHLGGDTAAEVGQCLFTRLDVWAQGLGGMDTSPDNPLPCNAYVTEDDGDDTLPITNTQRIEQQPLLELLADREQKAQKPGDLLTQLNRAFLNWDIPFAGVNTSAETVACLDMLRRRMPEDWRQAPPEAGSTTRQSRSMSSSLSTAMVTSSARQHISDGRSGIPFANAGPHASRSARQRDRVSMTGMALFREDINVSAATSNAAANAVPAPSSTSYDSSRIQQSRPKTGRPRPDCKTVLCDSLRQMPTAKA
jgi:hypothetical protein